MRRREFITLFGSAAAAWPLAADAQQVYNLRHIGVLMGVAEHDPDAQVRVAAFEQALQDLGWINGRTIRIDYRWPTDTENMQNVARDLMGSRPEVVIATGTAWVAAALRETNTTPIVFVLVSDPVGSGFVASWSRPNGNVTGLSNLEGPIGGKWLEMLKALAPRVKRAAMLFNPSMAAGSGSYFLGSFEATAHRSGMTPIAAPVRSAAEINGVLSALARDADAGFVVVPDQFLALQRSLLVKLAAQYCLPAVYPFRYFVTEGGLMSYGVFPADLYRRSAAYVDRILRGAKPSELPVQGPTRFELIVNRKTANALGLDVPRTLLAHVDEVIE
jgi:putative ABC transport system substrate-binding protein